MTHFLPSTSTFAQLSKVLLHLVNSESAGLTELAMVPVALLIVLATLLVISSPEPEPEEGDAMLACRYRLWVR